jgi:hypothetical protein
VNNLTELAISKSYFAIFRGGHLPWDITWPQPTVPGCVLQTFKLSYFNNWSEKWHFGINTHWEYINLPMMFGHICSPMVLGDGTTRLYSFQAMNLY